MKLWPLSLFLILAGCAAETPPISVGDDTFMVSKQGWISTQSMGQLKTQAFGAANAFCEGRHSAMRLVDVKETPGVLGFRYPEVEVRFRCGAS